ncbi:hypothetical protein FBU30_009359 [Linnemannia zychae]|nr:hypothetical protein FBU30_009359 [Linnemannia zychae]
MIPTPAPAPALPPPLSSTPVHPSDTSSFPNKSFHHPTPPPLPPKKHLQEQKKKDEPWISALFDSSVDPIVVCDLNGRVCAWSHSAETTFDIHSKHTLGHSLRHIFSGSSSPPTHSHTAAITSPSIPSTMMNSNADDPNSFEIELYPTTPDQVRALHGSPLKRVVTRVVGDQSRHIFLESISPLFHPSAAHSTTSRQPPPLPPKPLPPLPPRLPQSGVHHISTVGLDTDTRSCYGHNSYDSGDHSHTADKDDPPPTLLPTALQISAKEQESTPPMQSSTPAASSTSAPMLVGYSVILTDLTTLAGWWCPYIAFATFATHYKNIYS